MSGSRKWRGALACVLWASVVACFLTTGTTRNQPRSVKLRVLPSVDSGEAKGFWVAVQQAATRNKTDAETYMERIVAPANGHMNSKKIVDRSKAIEELILSMEQTGVLTCVLGGKNLGKSFLKEAALQRCSSNLVVLSEDMRNKPGANLLHALLQVANRTEEGQDLKAVVLPALSAIFSAGLVAFEGLGPAAVPISNSVKDAFVRLVADKTEKVRSALDEFLKMVGKKSKKNCNCGRRGKPCTTRLDMQMDRIVGRGAKPSQLWPR